MTAHRRRGQCAAIARSSPPSSRPVCRRGLRAAFLQQVAARYGGTGRWLTGHGFTGAGLGLLRAKLLRA